MEFKMLDRIGLGASFFARERYGGTLNYDGQFR